MDLYLVFSREADYFLPHIFHAVSGNFELCSTLFQAFCFFFSLSLSLNAVDLFVGSGQVLWTCTGRNKTLQPFMSLPVMDEMTGVNTALLGGYLRSSKIRARWAEGFHNELNNHMFNLERDGLRQVVPCP